MRDCYAKTIFDGYFESRCFYAHESDLANDALEILNYEKFEELLWCVARFKIGSIQIARNSLLLPEREKARLDIIRHLSKLLDDGYSVAVNFAEEFHPALARYSRRIGEHFGGKSNLSIFLSPASNPAFEPHIDAVDVIAVQVEGAKQWEIGDCDIFPLKGRTFTEEPQPALHSKYVLESGASLYVPRGCVHRVQTVSENPSLHISVALEIPKKAAVLEECIKVVQEASPALRASYRLDEQPVSLPELQNPYLLKNALKRIRARHLASLPQLPGRLRSLALKAAASKLTSDELVRRRADTACEVIFLGGRTPSAALSFPGLAAGRPDLGDALLIFPGVALSMLEFIQQTQVPFCADDLPGTAASALKLSVVNRLCDEGLLEPDLPWNK